MATTELTSKSHRTTRATRRESSPMRSSTSTTPTPMPAATVGEQSSFAQRGAKERPAAFLVAASERPRQVPFFRTTPGGRVAAANRARLGFRAP
jgi:hypothetical protein